MKNATDATRLPAQLSPHWAFVVQIREGSGFTPETLDGRVEHIVSGRATTFTKLGQLLDFIERTLASEERTEEE